MMNLFPVDRQPLRFTRNEQISAEEAARVHETAKKILAEVGIEVCQPQYLERLKQAGLRSSGSRVFFEPALVEEYVAEMRRLVQSWRAPQTGVDTGRLTLSVSSYALFVTDLDSGQVVPYDTPRLIQMTKLIDSLADSGVFGAPPGIPMEVQPDLQPLAQYRIAALYARQGATPVDPTSVRSARYLMEMAEVMGRPIRALPVYIPTPLRLGGESLDVVMASLDALDHISISSMPSTGTTAPIHPFGALALATAEVMGGMVAVKILTGKPVTFSVNIFPSDLREGSMVFGSPENMLFQMLGADLNRFYGHEAGPGPDNFHDMAKSAGGQSAAEKAAILSLGAFLGTRHFTSAGTLSLDEIFSAEQLLLDCEIRDWVQRGLQGTWLGEQAVEDWVEEISAGISRGFINRDSTLDYYKQHTWYPRWFERGAIGPWLNKGQPQLSTALNKEARRLIASHSFELEADKRRALDEIYQSAQRSLG